MHYRPVVLDGQGVPALQVRGQLVYGRDRSFDMPPRTALPDPVDAGIGVDADQQKLPGMDCLYFRDFHFLLRERVFSVYRHALSGSGMDRSRSG